MYKRILGSLMLLIFSMIGVASAENQVEVTTGVDFVNRYVWRGLDIANTPSIQPTLVGTFGGFELGTWGAYTLSNESSDADEIDFWLTYSRELESGVSFSATVTDYYFPNAGVSFFNFNNYDALKNGTTPDPGAHTLEVGLSITGPASFPMTVSGFMNIHNDAGNNTYFQLDYPVKVGTTDLTLFLGGTGGSEDNPGYYGTDELQVINVGMTAAREIEITDRFSLPTSVSLTVNPEAEISYLVVSISL